MAAISDPLQQRRIDQKYTNSFTLFRFKMSIMSHICLYVLFLLSYTLESKNSHQMFNCTSGKNVNVLSFISGIIWYRYLVMTLNMLKFYINISMTMMYCRDVAIAVLRPLVFCGRIFTAITKSHPQRSEVLRSDLDKCLPNIQDIQSGFVKVRQICVIGEPNHSQSATPYTRVCVKYIKMYLFSNGNGKISSHTCV